MAPTLAATVLLLFALVTSAHRRSGKEALDVPGESKRKEIIFVRHGQSTGNALGLSGSFSDFLGTAAKTVFSWKNLPRDSILSATGQDQVKERVEQFGASLNQRLLHSEVLIVSPLRRAMATSVLLMAYSYHAELTKREKAGHITDLCSGIEQYDFPLPEVRVMIELREKVKSSSDEIGNGVGPFAYSPDYVALLANGLEDTLFCKKHVLADLVLKLKNAFDAEEERTKKWTLHAENLETPTNAYLEAMNVQYAMKEIAKMPQQNFLLVGHSGWSRFAFTHLMPPAGGGFEDPDVNLKFNARQIRGLNNVGVLCVAMGRGVTGASTEDCTVESTDELDNFVHESSLTMFGLVPDAAASGKLPTDASVNRHWVTRKSSKEEDGILTISSSLLHHKWFLSWSSKWGTPKEGEQYAIELPASLQVDGETLLIQIGEHELRFTANPPLKRNFEDVLSEVEAWEASPLRQVKATKARRGVGDK